MRNVLVVLVPLCFGLTSGFIVPRGIQEIIERTVISNSSASKTNNTNDTFISKSDKASSTESNNDILDKKIYENVESKLSKVKARAYIYIKQNANNPVRNRIYDNALKIPVNTSYILHLNRVFEELPRQFSIGYMSMQANTESAKQDVKCHGMKVNEDQSKKYSRTQFMTLPNEQRDILDLLQNPSINNQVKHKSKGIRRGDTAVKFYSSATNIKDDNSQKNYQHIRNDNRYLLDELIRQKLDEKGSLFVCKDCDLPKKPKLMSRLHKEVICKCSSNLLPQEVEEMKHGP